jgi:hypothetical protein
VEKQRRNNSYLDIKVSDQNKKISDLVPDRGREIMVLKVGVEMFKERSVAGVGGLWTRTKETHRETRRPPHGGHAAVDALLRTYEN